MKAAAFARATFSILMFSGLAVICPAQGNAHDWAGVNTHCYEFQPETDTPAPAGYKPVYLSHYGRHGARTGMKVGDTYEKVASVLQRAADKKMLTPSGDSLLNEVLLVQACHNGMDGRLTRRGEYEQHVLAERIYKRYKPVFKNGCKKIRVEMSIVPRSIVSGQCFTQTLTSLQPDLQFSFDTGEKFFAYLDNSSTKEHSAAVKARRDSINALSVSDGAEFFARIFKDPARGAALIGDPEQFQHLVWMTASEGKASGLEVDMFRHLPEEVIHKWWADLVRSIYMRHGNSVEYGDIRMPRTIPLVSVILRQAQQALSCGNVAADLKFGHDYPVLATANWFGLEGVGDRLSWNDLPDAWSDPMNIPFSSNLQLVFYRNNAGDVLVKFVYNGRERRVRDLTAVSGPYYRWTDVLERFLPEGDERTFALADWGWKDLGRGAQAGYAQLPLFGSVQSISVIRYPMKKVSTCIANDSAAEADSTSALALRHGGFAAINASYFNVKTLYPTTYVKDDGKQEGFTTPPELYRVDGLVAVKNGKTVKIFASDTLSYAEKARGFREAIAGGPVLLKDGREARDVWPHLSFYYKRHPRTVIGTTADGWTYLIVIDGRFPGQGIGTTIHETAEICRMFGLQDALNLDGGGSSVLWTKEFGTVSHPYDNKRFDHSGQRVVPNVVYIK